MSDFKDSNENYGHQIKKLRQQLNLTQKQVADAIRVTPGYISNVENNRTAMSLRVLIYYAKLSGLTLDQLVGQLEPNYSSDSFDHELLSLISKMTTEEKRKLIQTINIWK